MVSDNDLITSDLEFAELFQQRTGMPFTKRNVEIELARLDAKLRPMGVVQCSQV